MGVMLRDFSGSYMVGILLLIAVGLAVFFAFLGRADRLTIGLLALGVAFPAVVYLTASSREFLKPRYQWWVGLVLVIAASYALGRLPRVARWGTALALILVPLIPVNWFNYRMAETTSPPFRDSFGWLRQQLRPGDVLVIDPQCTCGETTGWDYFLPQYFPTGYLPVVAHPGEASRVWYLSNDGWGRDEQLYAEVSQNRKPSIFVGPWYFLLRLYEGPPSWTGVAFGEAIHFNGVEVNPPAPALHENQQMAVKLWWSTDRPLDRDYSISVAVINESGAIITQQDGSASAPNTPAQTSAWQPGTYYEDYRMLQLPPGLQSGKYRLVATVYKWWESGNNRLPPQPNTLFPNITPDSYLVLKHFDVVSY
jgi:hypothetical protein